MSTRDEQKEKRRAEILQAGLDAFIKNGYSGMKIRNLAQQLNMSTGLLFHYFSSKEALFTELVSLGFSRPLQMVQEVGEVPPLQFFTICAQQTLMYAQSSAFTAKMFVFMKNCAYSTDIPPKAQEILDGTTMYKLTAPLIEQGQKDGTIRGGDALSLSTAFWAALQGAIECYAYDSSLILPKAEWIVDIIRNREEEL